MRPNNVITAAAADDDDHESDEDCDMIIPAVSRGTTRKTGQQEQR